MPRFFNSYFFKRESRLRFRDQFFEKVDRVNYRSVEPLSNFIDFGDEVLVEQIGQLFSACD